MFLCHIFLGGHGFVPLRIFQADLTRLPSFILAGAAT